MDIGNFEVLTQIGHDAGLDQDALAQANLTGKYRPRIENMRKVAARQGVTAADLHY